MDEQVVGGAAGLCQTTLSGMNNLFSKEFVDEFILKKISSICTDGTNVNIGERGGLWAYSNEKSRK